MKTELDEQNDSNNLPRNREDPAPPNFPGYQRYLPHNLSFVSPFCEHMVQKRNIVELKTELDWEHNKNEKMRQEFPDVHSKIERLVQQAANLREEKKHYKRLVEEYEEDRIMYKMCSDINYNNLCDINEHLQQAKEREAEKDKKIAVLEVELEYLNKKFEQIASDQKAKAQVEQTEQPAMVVKTKRPAKKGKAGKPAKVVKLEELSDFSE